MAKKSKEELLAELKKQGEQIDRHEEYMAKKKFEKKPKAIRRYEKYTRIAEEHDKQDNDEE